MALFPPIAPTYTAGKTSKSSTSDLPLGEGYKYYTNFGLNSTQSEWQLNWLVGQDEANTIEEFLQLCADNADFFQWQPPDSNLQFNWRCDEWSINHRDYDLFNITATFKRTFETATVTLNPVPSTCYNDFLCEIDIGENIAADIWVARLRGTAVGDEGNIGSAYSTSSYTFDTGYIYLAYSFNGFVNITKFLPTGKVAWSKEYPIFVDGSGASNPILLEADQENNRLFFSIQLGYNSGAFSGNSIGVFCIDAVSGAFRWGSQFEAGAYYVNCVNTPYPIGGTRVQGIAQFLLYNKYTNTIAAVYRKGSFSYVGANTYNASTGAGLYQISSDAYPSYPYDQPYQTKIGLLGDTLYSQGVLGDSDNYLLWPTIDDGIVPAYCTRLVNYLWNSTAGTRIIGVDFLDNGQMLAVALPYSGSNKVELIIFGANAQIELHVGFPGNALRGSFAQDWGGYTAVPGRKYFQATLDSDTSTLYFYITTDTGFTIHELDVALGGNKIIDIVRISRRVIISGRESFSVASYNNWGSMRPSSRASGRKRASYACGKFQSFANSEVGLYSVRRGYGVTTDRTNGMLISLGLEASSLIGTNSRVVFDDTYIYPVEFTPRITVDYNYFTDVNYSSSAGGAPCPGELFNIMNTWGSSTPVTDVTNNRIFDLYEYNL